MIIKKLVRFFTTLIEWGLRLGALLVSAAAIFGVAYFVGHVFFSGLRGNDSFNALNNIHWIERFFPKIPFWYPLQGGGVSFRWGYPFLSSVLVVLMDRLFGLGSVGAFQVLGFLSLPLTALGMYFFVWLRLKSQVGGLIAAVFYLVAPASWIWLFDWGFYAEHIAYIFFFPALIFIDYFFEAVINSKGGEGKARLSFVLSVIFGSLLFITHPQPFFSLAAILGVITLVRAIKKIKKIKPEVFLKSWGLTAIFSLVSLLVIGFVSLNYIYYSKFTFGFGKSFDMPKEDFVYNYSIPLKPFLGLERIPRDDFKFTMRNMVIPPHIWIPAILVLVLLPWVGVETFSLALVALISFILLFKPEIMYWLFRLKIPILPFIATMRGQIIILKHMIPVSAAMGIVGVGRLLVWLPTFWIKNKQRLLSSIKKLISFVVVPAFSLVVFGYLLINFANKPENMWKKHEVRYGPCLFSLRDPFFKFPVDICGTPEDIIGDKVDIEGISEEEEQLMQWVLTSCSVQQLVKEVSIEGTVCEEFNRIQEENISISEMQVKEVEPFRELALRCSEGKATAADRAFCPLTTHDMTKVREYFVSNLRDLSYWPQPKLMGSFEYGYLHPDYRDFIKEHQGDSWLRVDVSPTLGGVVQGINILSDISLINLYTVQLSLLGPYWGYEQQVMFSENDGRIETVNEMAKYFGLKYLFTTPEHDGTGKYERSEGVWESVGEVESTIWRYSEAPEIYSWYRDKPLILVVGDKEKRAFEPVFRAGIKGGIPYDEAILVEGKERVDDYSLAELSKFDALFLYGYHYKNRGKAWRLLEDYVTNGGSVFINTGWQYVDEDWEWEQTAALIPVERLEWKDDFTKTSVYEFSGEVIGDSDISVEKFGPLVWAGQGWGVSMGSGLKSWAKPVLEVEGRPLMVAGEFGEGRVFWSGLNIIGHSHTYDYNLDELKLLRESLNWLTGFSTSDDLTDLISPKRAYPDRLEFTFAEEMKEGSVFYWREALFPNWQAKLKGKKVEIYRAGPGFMVMRLPSINKGDTLVLEFKQGLRGLVINGVSGLTVLLLGFYLVMGGRIYKVISGWRRKRSGGLVKRMRDSWDKEE